MQLDKLAYAKAVQLCVVEKSTNLPYAKAARLCRFGVKASENITMHRARGGRACGDQVHWARERPAGHPRLNRVVLQPAVQLAAHG